MNKPLPVMPDFFEPSAKILALEGNRPLTKLDFEFDKYPDLTNFVPVFKDMIASGNLFKYEDYQYIHNNRVVNNLDECSALYTKTADGYTFNRYERMDNGKTLNFTVYNKNIGWFPEIKDNFPDLVAICDKFIEQYGVDVWKILMLKVDVDLPWHMDIDGFYGFRVHVTDEPYRLDFREIKEEHKAKFLEMSWKGQWQEVDALVPTETIDPTYSYGQPDAGKAFLNNSMDYVHYFYNDRTQYIALIKGTI